MNRHDVNVISEDCIFDCRRDEFHFLTVIIPTYKLVSFLIQTVDSLVAQCNKHFEVVVVDNDFGNICGLDQTLMSYRDKLAIALFRNPKNLGMFGNWDRGIELSRTKWVTILHDDDLFAPSFISDASHVIAETPSLELLLFRVNTFYGEDNPLNARAEPALPVGIQGLRNALLNDTIYKLSLVDYFFKNEHTGTLGAVFIRQNALALNGVNRFFEKYGYVSDFAFFVEYCRRYHSTFLYNHPAAYYRFHINESLKYEVILSFIDYCKIIRSEILEEYGFKGRCGTMLNAMVTAYQIKASSGLKCPEYIANLIPYVIRHHGLTRLSYELYQIVVRVIYNLAQLRRVCSRRIKCPRSN